MSPHNEPEWEPYWDPDQASAQHLNVQRRRTRSRVTRQRTNTLQHLRNTSGGRYPAITPQLEEPRALPFLSPQPLLHTPHQAPPPRNHHVNDRQEGKTALDFLAGPAYGDPRRVLEHPSLTFFHPEETERLIDEADERDRQESEATQLLEAPETFFNPLHPSARTVELVANHCPTPTTLQERHGALVDVQATEEKKALKVRVYKKLKKTFKKDKKRPAIVVQNHIVNRKELEFVFREGGKFHTPDPAAFRASPQDQSEEDPHKGFCQPEETLSPLCSDERFRQELDDPFAPSPTLRSQRFGAGFATDSSFTRRLLLERNKFAEKAPSQKAVGRKVSELAAKFEGRSGTNVTGVPYHVHHQLRDEERFRSREEEHPSDFCSVRDTYEPAPPVPARSGLRQPRRGDQETGIASYDKQVEQLSQSPSWRTPYVSLWEREQALRAHPTFPLANRTPVVTQTISGPETEPEQDAQQSRSLVYSPSIYSQGESTLYSQREFTPPSAFPNLLPLPLSVIKSPTQSRDSTFDTPTRRRVPAFHDPNNRNFLLSVSPAPAADVYHTGYSFLGSRHPAFTLWQSEVEDIMMATLQIQSVDRQTTRMKAIEDARKMQANVIEECKRTGKEPPKYFLLELIGKGSFGRVYKGKDMASAEVVAVKIIDIDESDTLNPRLADTYSEFMKEVNTLKILSDNKARNINHVIEALPVGKAMWMITEYCGGGSIATLMKPTPNGLKERFIIPILREVAEAVKWCHQAGVIHRDLKCANVLITEEGGVQLCDFGVSGMTENPLDKRSTFIGTPHWMAPEIFTGKAYGKEVDIWAFGSMAFEMATGLPPNAREGFGGADLNQNPQMVAAHLEKHVPRLDAGGRYSDGLRDLVKFCLVFKSTNRPTIQQVQGHPYIWNTDNQYPASSLSDLVMAFKLWEEHGGSRKSLFMFGGAQNSSELSSEAVDDDWNFSTTATFDQAVADDTRSTAVIDDVYGQAAYSEETSRPAPRSTRRRPPPEALAPLRAPIERLFDPNTISNYNENSRSHYGLAVNPTSDLPLRDDSAQTSIRDTMIDLGGHDAETGMSSFPEGTIKGRQARDDVSHDDFDAGPMIDYSRPALSDPADNPNRRTQDWTFPSMTNPPATANPELNRFPGAYEVPRPMVTPGSGSRPALIHHPTEPIGLPSITNSLMPSAPGSPSRLSLIDLDLSLPEPSRPSTADSSASQEITSANPFHLEHHTSLYKNGNLREPSLYLSDSSSLKETLNLGAPMIDLNEVSDFSASDTEGGYLNGTGHSSDFARFGSGGFRESTYSQSAMPPPLHVPQNSRSRPSQSYTMDNFPALPPPPSAVALSGTANDEEMASEMQRMLGGLTNQLESFRDVYDDLPRRERQRRERGSGTDVE